MTLEYLQQTMLSFKEICVSVQYLEATRKGVQKTDRKTPLPDSIFNNLNFPKNGFHQSRFRKKKVVFKKR